MPKKVDIPALTSVALTPHPGGYFLDAWLDGADPAAGGENMQRFKFDSTQQMVDFSREVRRTALLSVGFEELVTDAGDVLIGDLFPMINSLGVDGIDLEKKFAEIVPTSDLDEMVTYCHFSFKNSTATVSMKATDRLTILRQIR